MFALDVLRIVIKKSKVLYLILEAVTEIVPDLISAPDFFVPQEICDPRNLAPT